MPQTKDQKRRKAIDRHTKYAEQWEAVAKDYHYQLSQILNKTSELHKRVTEFWQHAIKTMESHKVIVSNTRTALGR